MQIQKWGFGIRVNIKYYDETKMRTRQKQCVATGTWRSLGCRTTPLEQKKTQQLNPGGPINRQKKIRPQPTKIALCRGHHCILGLTDRRAIKEGSKVINRDWVKH